MKAKVFIAVLLLMASPVFGQKVIFLHHSTGNGVYYEGNVAGWIADYNAMKGTDCRITERSYPDSPYPWANYPYDYWNLWVNHQCSNADTDIHCLDKLVQDYDVIVFKHCFPGASVVEADANPSVSSPVQTLANYKLQYRALRALMDGYPNNRFIVWTLAPLHRLATNTGDAARAREFVDWVKSVWLTEDSKPHSNIFVFDFFGYAAESNPTPLSGKVNCLKYNYEGSHTGDDSHPNTIANQTIGPLFAEFVVNTSSLLAPCALSLEPSLSVWPNPVSYLATLRFAVPTDQPVVIEVTDFAGRLVQKLNLGTLTAGLHLKPWNTETLKPGVYSVQMKNNPSVNVKVVLTR